MKLPASSASFGPPRVFYFPGTHRIRWASPYPPPGEAPDGRPATSHGKNSFYVLKKKTCPGFVRHAAYSMFKFPRNTVILKISFFIYNPHQELNFKLFSNFASLNDLANEHKIIIYSMRLSYSFSQWNTSNYLLSEK